MRTAKGATKKERKEMLKTCTGRRRGSPSGWPPCMERANMFTKHCSIKCWSKTDSCVRALPETRVCWNDVDNHASSRDLWKQPWTGVAVCRKGKKMKPMCVAQSTRWWHKMATRSNQINQLNYKAHVISIGHRFGSLVEESIKLIIKQVVPIVFLNLKLRFLIDLKCDERFSWDDLPPFLDQSKCFNEKSNQGGQHR